MTINAGPRPLIGSPNSAPANVLWCSFDHVARARSAISLTQLTTIEKGGRFSAVPRRMENSHFRLVIAVRSAESLTIPAAPHQLEPAPPGLIGVTLAVPEALKALVNALQSPFDKLVSE